MTAISEATLAAALTEWDRRYREEPSRFQSDAERLANSCESYGAYAACYLIKIIAEQNP